MWPPLKAEAKVKKSKFCESRYVVIVKEAEAGVPSPEVARQHGIISESLYTLDEQVRESDVLVVVWDPGNRGQDRNANVYVYSPYT
jgi:hypothetical protein